MSAVFRESAIALAPPFLDDLGRVALFLDIDGTLLELQPRPRDVAADERLCALLRALEQRVGGALAILTGRSLPDADRILRGSVRCVAALHGNDCRLHRGVLRQKAAQPSWLAAKEIVRKLVQSGALAAELEDKGRALALHYRARPEQGALIIRAVDEIAARHGLRALHGKMVSELLPFGADKGVALSTFMQAPPFYGRVPVAVGDDLTDEDAFRAAGALGGVSVLVGSRENSAARYALADAQAVRAWLGAAL